MRRPAKRIFIFDLDGTLVDAYTAIEKSLNYTRVRFGRSEVSCRTVKKRVGRGDAHFISLFFARSQLKQALALYRSHHRTALSRYAVLMPGARMLLYRLKRKKKIVAVASNRPVFFARILLTALGIRKYIDYVLCADMLDHAKPHPQILRKILGRFDMKPDEAVYVGDMAIDVEAARRASIDAVFIRGGSSPAREVKKYTNVRIVSALKEILHIYE